MKLKILGFILLTCSSFLSCNTYKRDKFHYREEIKSSKLFWINVFKEEAFYACLKEGYKNDSIYKLMRKKDLFNSSDFVDLESRKKARVLGKKIITNLPPPYIHVDDENIEGKNFISASCLHYFASRELDSIAKEEYKKYLKKEKILEKGRK